MAVVLFAICFLAQVISAQWGSQVPYWPQYPLRIVQVMDGEWQFGYSETADPMGISPLDIFTPSVTNVPSSFDVAPPGIPGPRGTAFYRATFFLDVNTPGMVYFTACSFYCRVFIDNIELGDHRAGGYQPFWFPIPLSQSTTRELLVISNNQFNFTTAPTHIENSDFWQYGGITRSVIIHQLPSPTFLLRVETFTVDLSGIIDVNIVLGGNTDVDSIVISLAWDNGTASSPFTVNVNANGTAVLSNITLPNSSVWSIETPNLHTLTVYLHSGETTDAIQVRFGIRLLSVDKETSRLLINNEVVKLHGVNRHTMRLDTGSALTLAQVQEDIPILKAMNVNYVRGAHYPQDPRFLDLLDENGIVLWEETLGPGVTLQDLQSEYFMQYQIQAVNEMIDASINHPCIIFHAFYNEGPSNQPQACPGYNASAMAIRARVGNPPSRLITWANNQLTEDKCIEIEDVIAFNAYPAWYIEPGNLSSIVPFWTLMADWANKNWPTKPFFISETGASGIFEWTNSSLPMWSQGFEAEVVALDAGFAVNASSVSGITLWQFSDIKINDQQTAACGECVYFPHPDDMSVPWNCSYIAPANATCTRPGGENHKGQVDFWRRIKESYGVVQQIYGNADKNK